MFVKNRLLVYFNTLIDNGQSMTWFFTNTDFKKSLFHFCYNSNFFNTARTVLTPNFES